MNANLRTRDWIWVILTIIAGGFVVLYSFIQPIQDLMKLVGVDLNNSFVMTVFWLGWFVIGHDEVTLWLARFNNSHWHLMFGAIGIALIALGLSWNVIARILEYLQKNGDPRIGPFILIAIALGLLAWWLRGRRAAQPNTGG